MKGKTMGPLLGWAGGFVLANSLAAVYVAYIATSSTAEKQRAGLIEHVNDDVIKKLIKLERAPDPEKIKALYADIALLRRNIEIGWVTLAEQAAAVRVLSFVLSAHTGETLSGLGKLMDDASDKIFEKIEKLMDDMGVPKDNANDKKDAA